MSTAFGSLPLRWCTAGLSLKKILIAMAGSASLTVIAWAEKTLKLKFGHPHRRRECMFKYSHLLRGILAALFVASCASLSPTGETGGSLVGAWIVTASRPAGVGRIFLLFLRMALSFGAEIRIPYSAARMVPGSVLAIESLMLPISRFAIKVESGSEAPKLGYTLLLALEATSLLVWPKSAHATWRKRKPARPKRG